MNIKPFREFVGESIGEASMCWDHGVFDSERASKIVDAIVERHEKELEEKLSIAVETLKFYGTPEPRKDYREAFTMARVISEDLSKYFYNGINYTISGKKAREALEKIGEKG